MTSRTARCSSQAARITASLRSAMPGTWVSWSMYLAQTYGAITPDAARKGLELFAEHADDARQFPGRHPNIDRLLGLIEEKKTLRIKHVFAV